MSEQLGRHDPHSAEPLSLSQEGETILPDEDWEFYENGSEKPHEITSWVGHARARAEEKGVYDDTSPQSGLGGGDYDSWRDARQARARLARQADGEYYKEQFGLSGRPEADQPQAPPVVRRMAAVAAFIDLLDRGYSPSQAMAIRRTREEERGK